MRYFRYKHEDKVERIATRAQYAALTKKEKRAERRVKCWRICGTITFLVVLLGCFSGMMLLSMLLPQATAIWIEVLLIIGAVVWGFVSLIVSAGIAAFACTPFFNKADMGYRTIKKEFLAQACEHLRVHYGLQEPCIVTKCYAASDACFANHDVCLFVSEGELRVTTDLQRGFLYGDRDLGCYAFTAEEITVSRVPFETYIATELRAGETVFLFGARGAGFIKNKFLCHVQE